MPTFLPAASRPGCSCCQIEIGWYGERTPTVCEPDVFVCVECGGLSAAIWDGPSLQLRSLTLREMIDLPTRPDLAEIKALQDPVLNKMIG